MNDTSYERQGSMETPGEKHTELTSKNEIWSKLPKPASYLSVNVTVIQEASAAVLIRVSHTWEALMPVPPILSFWL